MIDRIKGQGRSPIDNSRVMKWKNVSGEEIPAYGVVKLQDYVADDDYFEAVKPDGDGSLHFVNGPVAIASNAFGESQMWDISRIGKASGMFGEVVGPVADSWEMTTEGTGFIVFSTPDDYAGTAALLKDGGSGGGQSIWFTIDEVLCPGVDDVEEETLVVTAEWYTGGCSKTPPGANYGGTYNVYGYCSGFNGLTPTELEGTKGKATYACPLSGYCEPRWLLDFLCGLPQC